MLDSRWIVRSERAVVGLRALRPLESEPGVAPCGVVVVLFSGHDRGDAPAE